MHFRTPSGRHFSTLAGEALAQLEQCQRETAELRTTVRACRRPPRLLIVGGADWTTAILADLGDVISRVHVDLARDPAAAREVAEQYDIVAIQPGAERFAQTTAPLTHGIVTGDAGAVSEAVRLILSPA